MPQSTKEPGGAEKRRRNNAARALELQAELARLGVKPSAPEDDPGDDPEVMAAFASIGPPPLDNPETALAWVRQMQLTATWIAATKPLTDALRDRLKNIREFCATVGMTQNRSDIEEIAERLEGALAGARQSGHVASKPVASERPHTARGTRPGPRPMATLPRDDEPEDDPPLKSV